MKFLAIIFMTLFLFSANCTDDFQIIRDAEIEEVLTKIAQNIFDVAGLKKKKAKLYIVKSNSINAFTIGNGYLFVTSELLLKFKNPIHFIAVLSHETGHIAALHVENFMNRIMNSQRSFLLAMLAGIVGGLATGSADAMAVLLGYAMTNERLLLRFSRDQEAAADSLGASYMEKMGYSPKAMVEVFQQFDHMEELGGASSIPTYVRTHPKATNRISALLNRKSDKKLSSTCDKKLSESYKRVTEKLRAYLCPKNSFTHNQFDDYPKAIYLHRNGKISEAIDIMKKLLQKNPNDFYYKETLAMMLNDFGKPAEAIKYYEQIYNKANTLIKIDYAKALLETKQADKAIKILETAKYEDRLNPEIFRLLANGYGQKNRRGVSFLMLAQEEMLLQNYQNAHNLLKASIPLMDPKNDASRIKQAKYFKQLLEREKLNR